MTAKKQTLLCLYGLHIYEMRILPLFGNKARVIVFNGIIGFFLCPSKWGVKWLGPTRLQNIGLILTWCSVEAPPVSFVRLTVKHIKTASYVFMLFFGVWPPVKVTALLPRYHGSTWDNLKLYLSERYLQSPWPGQGERWRQTDGSTHSPSVWAERQTWPIEWWSYESPVVLIHCPARSYLSRCPVNKRW